VTIDAPFERTAPVSASHAQGGGSRRHRRRCERPDDARDRAPGAGVREAVRRVAPELSRPGWKCARMRSLANGGTVRISTSLARGAIGCGLRWASRAGRLITSAGAIRIEVSARRTSLCVSGLDALRRRDTARVRRHPRTDEGRRRSAVRRLRTGLSAVTFGRPGLRYR